jgi:hypothetical protein
MTGALESTMQTQQTGRLHSSCSSDARQVAEATKGIGQWSGEGVGGKVQETANEKREWSALQIITITTLVQNRVSAFPRSGFCFAIIMVQMLIIQSKSYSKFARVESASGKEPDKRFCLKSKSLRRRQCGVKDTG